MSCPVCVQEGPYIRGWAGSSQCFLGLTLGLDTDKVTLCHAMSQGTAISVPHTKHRYYTTRNPEVHPLETQGKQHKTPVTATSYRPTPHLEAGPIQWWVMLTQPQRQHEASQAMISGGSHPAIEHTSIPNAGLINQKKMKHQLPQHVTLGARLASHLPGTQGATPLAER
jgi:hypothetical protein